MLINKSNESAYDLANWIEKAEIYEQMKSIGNIGSLLEIGDLAGSNNKRGGPALLFKDIPGYRDGFRVLTGAMLNAKTLGMTMGVNKKVYNTGLVKEIAERLHYWERKAPEYSIEFVDSGPVMKNSLYGMDVDLNIFPTPAIKLKDGNLFYGAGCIQILKDPDNNEIDIGTYCIKFLGKNIIKNHISPRFNEHNVLKYWRQGKPAPVVISFGHHPIFQLIGSYNMFANDISKFGLIGAINGWSVPAIQGRITGLPIPAYSEIAAEGWIYPDQSVTEVALDKSKDYCNTGNNNHSCILLKALYYRNQPVLFGALPNHTMNDFSYYFSVMRSAGVQKVLTNFGVSGVCGVWVYEVGNGIISIVTSISQQYKEHAYQASVIAAACHSVNLLVHSSIVVDENVDPSDPNDVIRALKTHSNRNDAIDVISQYGTDTFYDCTTGNTFDRRILINACKSMES